MLNKLTIGALGLVFTFSIIYSLYLWVAVMTQGVPVTNTDAFFVGMGVTVGLILFVNRRKPNEKGNKKG
jgi:hypothetical protein